MRIVFMGTPAAAVPSLHRCLEDGHEVVAVWTQPDRPAGRGHKLSTSPVKEFAIAKGLTIHQPITIRTEEARTLFTSHGADIVVVVAYGKILPGDFLRAPKRGCINVHFSLLPLYRGAAPVNWAIVNGEVRTGVTTMFMEETLDTGPILLQRETLIGKEETAPELSNRLALLGADLLGETMRDLDRLTPRPQHDRDATFAPMLKKEDGQIVWTNDAFAIERAIRGFQPWPTAFSSYHSHRLIIWKATPLANGLHQGLPGEVLTASEDLTVQCGNNTALRVLEVQAEAKRRMSVRDFLNGGQVEVGIRLGE